MKRLFSILVLSGCLAGATFAYAQYGSDFVGPQQADPFAQNGTVERCGPQTNGDYILCEAVGGLIRQRQTNFAAFLREMYVLAFILAGTVAFVRIVYGGLIYSWSGVVDRKKEAIGIFWDVAIGMGLLMGSYVILNTINPALTILALPNVTMGTAQNPFPADRTLGEGATPIGALDNAISNIRQENEAIINGLGLYVPAPDDEATVGLINDQINALGSPTDAAGRARLTELQKTLSDYQAAKAQADADAAAVTGTAPQQYKRAKSSP